MRVRALAAAGALVVAAVLGGARSAAAQDEGDVADRFGLINFGNDSDLLSNINVCEIEVNVIAVPILSNNDESLCLGTDNDGEDEEQ